MVMRSEISIMVEMHRWGGWATIMKNVYVVKRSSIIQTESSLRRPVFIYDLSVVYEKFQHFIATNAYRGPLIHPERAHGIGGKQRCQESESCYILFSLGLQVAQSYVHIPSYIP